jgi:hypothetical protein
MTSPEPDQRSANRLAQDEQIAAEPSLAFPELPQGSAALPVEVHLGRQRPRPLAVPGVVENGLVRPLDPTVRLPEHARVIIVAAEIG